MKVMLPTFALIAVFVVGCSQQAAPPAANQAGGTSKSQVAHVDEHDHDHKDGDHDHDHDKGKAESGKKAHDHSGWWCAEHGVPEKECSQCSSKVAADFQKKGDWCAEHDRAKSQCFICDPSLKEKFAAQYRAKEGKEPPALEEDEGKEEHKDEKKS